MYGSEENFKAFVDWQVVEEKHNLNPDTSYYEMSRYDSKIGISNLPRGGARRMGGLTFTRNRAQAQSLSSQPTSSGVSV
jgi:hypothetical protein